MTSSITSIRQRLRRLHDGPQSTFRHVTAGALHLLLVVACIAAWRHEVWPVSVTLWLAIVWMDHAALARLHEAAHRILFRTRIANELAGVFIGTLALTPLSVYRYVHTQHHAHLGREKDPEFWPYNLPRAPRWLRLIYAWLELGFGWIVTPFLYSIRTARAWPTLTGPLKRRLVFEWSGLLLFWLAILSAVALTQTWNWFVIVHLVPTWIAGTVQTIRKFTEHLGRFGDNILDMTRTVVYTQRLGRKASRSQLHVEHHGTHHRWPRIPYHRLPEATEIVYGAEQKEGRIYPSHLAALHDMWPHLSDPKLGPQWFS